MIDIVRMRSEVAAASIHDASCHMYIHVVGIEMLETLQSYAHTYIHTYIHTYVHTYVHVQNSSPWKLPPILVHFPHAQNCLVITCKASFFIEFLCGSFPGQSFPLEVSINNPGSLC